MKKISLLAFVLSGLLLMRCNDNEDPGRLDQYSSTYAVIQGEIWDQSCTSCHAAGTSFARQSDLILTADVSYEQLINRSPNNQAALEDGLELVGDAGLESIYRSFLWEKINALDIEHFYSDHPEYGSIMPLGDDFLTNGQLEYIREWILAGAPKEGHVADVDLLKNEDRYEIPAFAALDPPESGYQFNVGPFEVQPGEDREIFVYEPLNNDEPVYINQVEIVMRPGSHHFILYNFPEEFVPSLLPNEGLIRDVYEPNGEYRLTTLFHMQYHQFIAGTQWPRLNYRFPEGVALEVPANTGFDLNSHYANKSEDAVTGEVYANIHTIPSTHVEHVARVLNLNYDDFILPARRVTTLEREYYFRNEANIFQLFSHAHSKMTEFKVYVIGGQRDGELVYVSYDWEHPPILELDPPLTIGANQGLRLEVTYDNDENRDLSFGLRSTDEMMILFGAYYE